MHVYVYVLLLCLLINRVHAHIHMHKRILARAHTHMCPASGARCPCMCERGYISIYHHQQQLHPNIDYKMYNQTTQPAARCKYETLSTLILHLSKKFSMCIPIPIDELRFLKRLKR